MLAGIATSMPETNAGPEREADPGRSPEQDLVVDAGVSGTTYVAARSRWNRSGQHDNRDEDRGDRGSPAQSEVVAQAETELVEAVQGEQVGEIGHREEQ